MARTHGEPLALASTIKRAVGELDPAQPVMKVQPMSALVYESVAQPRFQLTLVGLFAILALVLALVGLYGVIAYLVAQRTQEIGIRIALGAQKRDVLRLVVGRGLMLTVIGAAIGVGVAAATTHLLRAMLRRAASVDPMVALRDE